MVKKVRKQTDYYFPPSFAAGKVDQKRYDFSHEQEEERRLSVLRFHFDYFLVCVGVGTDQARTRKALTLFTSPSRIHT